VAKSSSKFYPDLKQLGMGGFSLQLIQPSCTLGLGVSWLDACREDLKIE